MRRIPPTLAGIAAAVLSYMFGYQDYVAFNDATAAAYPAWLLVHRGTLAIPNTPHALMWVRGEWVDTGHGIYSDRPIGMILASVPGQLFPAHYSLLATNALGAAVVGLIVLLYVRLVEGNPVPTMLATLGTPLLYVEGRTLWPGAVDIACLLGIIVLQRAVNARTGIAWSVGAFLLVAFATMCRPPLGLLVLLVVIVNSWSARGDRRDKVLWHGPAVAGFLAGAAALVWYAYHFFGTYNPAGAYPVSHHAHLDALVLGIFSPARGVLFYSPWLLFVRPPDRRAHIILWLAIAYTLGVYMTYDAWGGAGFIGYRYGVPLAVIVSNWTRLTSWPAKAAVAWSVAIGIVTLTIGHRPVAIGGSWSTSGLAWEVLAYTGLLAALLLLGTWWLGRHRVMASGRRLIRDLQSVGDTGIEPVTPAV